MFTTQNSPEQSFPCVSLARTGGRWETHREEDSTLHTAHYKDVHNTLHTAHYKNMHYTLYTTRMYTTHQTQRTAYCTLQGCTRHTESTLHIKLSKLNTLNMAHLLGVHWTLDIIPRPGNLHIGNICQCYPCRSRAIWRRTGSSIMSVSHTPN